MRRFFSAAVLPLLLFAFSAVPSFAQSGSVSGSVADPSGALIPGVTITAVNTETSVSTTVLSNEAGAYTFPSLQAGTYKLNATLPGFQTAAFDNVSVGAATQIRLNFTLKVGGVTQSVDVAVDAQSLLTTSSSSIGEVLTEQRVRDLPMVRGDVLDLVRIMPGMRVDPFGDQFSAFTGLPSNTINTTRDGLSVTDTRNNVLSATTTMNPDLVGEIRVILSPVDAEFGRGNGQVQIQTRSGTNRYTGAAVWNVRNTGLAANTWVNNRTVDPFTGKWSPTPLDWRNTHQYTVSYGGPIVKNKTFFFALWDQNISRTRTLVTNNVLTDEARKGIFRYFDNWNGGDAQALIPTFPASTTAGTYPVVDASGRPLTPAFNPNGTPYTGSLHCYSVFGNVKFDGSPFTAADCPGGIAATSPSSWDPLRPTADATGYIRKLIDTMPRANYFSSGAATVDGLNLAQFRWVRRRSGNNGANAQNGASPDLVNRKQFNLKVDHNFNASHRVAVGWSYQLDDNSDNLANWENGFHGNSKRRPQVLTTNFTSTLSPTIVNEARFGISYGYNEVNPAWKSTDPDVRKGAESWLLQGGTGNGSVPYPVVFTPGAGNYAFGNTTILAASTYSGSSSPLYNYADTLSWNRGAHSFRMGGDARFTRSSGYSGSVFPTATGGAGNNNSSLVNAIAALPNQLAGNRTNAANMLYLLAGSLNSTSTLYWISSIDDVKKGVWQDYVTADKRKRNQVQNEWAAFVKDDWKARSNLTLNLGVRYEFYGSPFLRGGYTASVVDRGAGLFGVGRSKTAGLFDSWMAPGNIYLSGYGPNATAATALQCTSGAAQNPLLPAATCDPSKLTSIEYVGPGSDHRSKTAIPNDWNNFGPAIGFAWSPKMFGAGKTSIRGGFSVTFGLAARNFATTETIIGNVPGASSTANLTLSDFPGLTTNRALRLEDLKQILPVVPNSPAKPGGQVPIYNRATPIVAYDPDYATPYTENMTLSVTRTVNRHMTVDIRYEGTLGRKRADSANALGGATGPGINLNLPNVYYNKELFDALEITRRGGDAALFDQMFAGLNLAGQTTGGYGAVGTCTVVAGAPGGDGCPAGQVMQHGSAHLRRNATFTSNLALGNYDAIASTLNTLSTVTAGLQPLPAGLTGVNGRILRNGCDRLAAGLTAITTRCFPENYIVANPQLSTATYLGNYGKSNFHSLQTQFTLRPYHGMSFQTTYTWAKTLGLVPGGWTDPLNRNADYAPPYQAVAHDLRTNGTFEIPVGPNKLFFGNSSGWVARAIEGWQTSIILNVSSGNPRTIVGSHMFYAAGNQNLDIAQNRADIVSNQFDREMRGHVVWNGPGNNSGLYYGDKWTPVVDPQCALTNKTDSMGFNLFTNGSCTLQAIAMKNSDGTTGPIVLQNPTPGHRGNMPFSLEAPGKWKFDANMSKSFKITDSKTLQLRIDAANVLNHADLADPEPQTGQSINTSTASFGRVPTKGGNGSGAAPRSFQAQLRLTF